MIGYTDTERMIRNEGEHPDCFRKLPLYERAAATYSPTWWGSTIGASELNFSVRMDRGGTSPLLPPRSFSGRPSSLPYISEDSITQFLAPNASGY